jgi:hypothetical protein
MASGRLIGKWFHSFDAEGDIKWQGRILGKPDGLYLVQLHEWLMGDPSDQILVAPPDMKGWHFYDSPEAMRAAYEVERDRRGAKTARR